MTQDKPLASIKACFGEHQEPTGAREMPVSLARNYHDCPALFDPAARWSWRSVMLILLQHSRSSMAAWRRAGCMKMKPRSLVNHHKRIPPETTLEAEIPPLHPLTSDPGVQVACHFADELNLQLYLTQDEPEHD